MAEETIYKSINGFDVEKTADVVLLDPRIKQVFIDSITLEYFKRPVYVPEPKMIYDHASIQQWLLTSDKDPLTGIKLDAKKLDIFPVLNFMLAMLCIEEKNDDLYYHVPMGNLFDLLKIAFFVYEGHEFKRFNHVCLDLKKYVDIDVEITADKMTYCQNIYGQNYKRTCLYQPVNIDDILAICPVSRRLLGSTFAISDHGVFVHKTLGGFRQSFSVGNKLGEMADYYSSKRPMPVTNHTICEIFDNGTTTQFTIDVNRTEEPLVSYSQISNESVIKVNMIEYDTLGYLMIFDAFKKQKALVDNIHCLTVKSNKQVLYEFYLKHKDGLNVAAKNALSEMLASYDITKFGQEFVKKREFYNFPSVYKSADLIYGNDYSFLELKSREVKNGDFKCVSFVGTTFNKTLFGRCCFYECSFIGANMINCVMLGCKFVSCCFYKTTRSRSPLSSFENTGCTFTNCDMDTT